MPTVILADIPTEEFALRTSLNRVSELRVESQRVVEKNRDLALPLLWVRGADRENIEAAFASDDSVRTFDCLADYEDKMLYRMEWVRDVKLAVRMITEDDATVLDLYGTGEGWTMRAMFPDRDALSRTSDFCAEHGLSLDIRRVREMDANPSGRWGLTDEQYEALRAAWEAGYFDVPRRTDISELAEELDVSHQALSERLRRAHDSLLKETVGVGTPDRE